MDFTTTKKPLQMDESKEAPHPYNSDDQVIKAKGTYDLSILENDEDFPEGIVTTLFIVGRWDRNKPGST